MASRKLVGDDLDLSLTGSQISGRSSSRRPESAGQIKRPNSMVDIRQSKSDKNSSTAVEGKRNGVGAAHKVPSSPISHRSSVSAASSRMSKPLSLTNMDGGGDFLSFFENNTQPKIRRPASATSSGTGKGKKPAANAVKVLWEESPLKVSAAIPATDRHKNGASNKSGVAAMPSDRSEGPHNIFRPDSALSQSDEDLDDIEESLSQSINKLQTLQSQLSGINKNNPNDMLPPPSLALLNSHRSADSATPRNMSAAPTPRNVSAGSSPRDSSTKCSSSKNIASGLNADLLTVSLANNITSQGQKQKTKASLSSMENSYQNIKHKMPVNQVGRPSSSSTASTFVKQSASHAPVEESLRMLNTAATKIQRWYKRHHIRHMAEKAAMCRFLSQKRDEILQQSTAFQEEKHQRQEDRKRAKQDREHQARLEAIKVWLLPRCSRQWCYL